MEGEYMNVKGTTWIVAVSVVGLLAMGICVANASLVSAWAPIMGSDNTLTDFSMPMSSGLSGIASNDAFMPLASLNTQSSLNPVTIGNSGLQGVSMSGIGPGPINLVETPPHGNASNAFEVPEGTTVLANGDMLNGDAIGHVMPPMIPGYWTQANMSNAIPA
jgi:hypothetical protein